MKALTICQPYAELILLGEKRIENRSWPTNYRGPLVIHAGKSRAWLESYSPLPGKMEFGAIVGIADLLDVVHFTRILSRKKGTKSRRLPPAYQWLKTHLHAEGPFCWILENVRRLIDPIEYRGRQGMFEVDDSIADAPTVEAGPRCRVCGCTNDNACPEGCAWVEPDLCSECF
jgi:activating signal cointegrator 1